MRAAPPSRVIAAIWMAGRRCSTLKETRSLPPASISRISLITASPGASIGSNRSQLTPSAGTGKYSRWKEPADFSGSRTERSSVNAGASAQKTCAKVPADVRISISRMRPEPDGLAQPATPSERRTRTSAVARPAPSRPRGWGAARAGGGARKILFTSGE